MRDYIIALDQGTSSSRAIVFNRNGEAKAVRQKEFTQHFPQPGMVEHDPMEIWATEYAMMTEAVTSLGLGGADIAAIGITNQRETTIVWDAETGKPIYNAIVWQDRRTSEYCDSLKAAGMTDIIRRKTGLIIDAYFSGTKIRWILDNVPGARERAEQGKLRFGTVDSWLVWNLTGGHEHVTDVSNASRTMLFNINTLQWDEELLDILNIPLSMMPQVKSSSEIYGQTNLLGGEVPVAGIAGDQQAALFGQMCTEPCEKHLRNGMLSFDEHRREADNVAQQPFGDHRLEDRRQGQLRFGGIDFRCRVCGSVASRRSRDHQEFLGGRGLGCIRS